MKSIIYNKGIDELVYLCYYDYK